jgi:NhaP-type Na+/H+ or K+/H+ antiporter
VILEGESLFNDASALLTYRLAVIAALTGGFSLGSAVPTFLLVAAGSVALAAILSRVSLYVSARIHDVATAVIVQFVSTFAVWIIAERLHLSGIITVVVFAILVARVAPDLIPARLRIQSYAVWEVAVFVLNVLAFILIGLQLKPILDRLATAELVRYIEIAGAVCAAVILVRIVWVMGFVLLGRWAGERKLKARGATVVAWCGMRGIVTLAAALALPAIPYRDLILFTAFCVVLVTLVLQGMTVTPLMRALALRDDGSVDREVREARVETLRAGLAAVDDGPHEGDMVAFLRRKFAARLRRAEHGGDARDPERDGWGEYADALGRAQRAQRRVLMELRSEGVIGDDAFHRIEEELDWAEVNTAPGREDEELERDSAAPPEGRDGRGRSEGTSA